MFPAHPIGRHRVFWRRRFFVRGSKKRIRHIIGIGRFGQIIDSAKFYGRDRRGDIAVTGEDNGAGIGAGTRQLGDDIKTGAVF